MGRWFKQFETIIWAVTMALASLAFVYQSFATKEYVNQKHESVMDILHRIDDTVRTVDQRVYDMSKGRNTASP